MANLTHKLQMTITSSSGVASATGYDAEAPNSEIAGTQGIAFAANSNSAAFSLAFNSAKLQSVFIVANQNCTLNTVGTNSTSLSLVAGIPFIWGVSMPSGSPYPSNPFNGTVNSATLSCNAATQLRYLIGTL